MICCYSLAANSQTSKPNIYLDLGISYPMSKTIGLHLSANMITKNNFLIDVNANSILLGVKNVPSNYSAGFGFSTPNDDLSYYGVNLGKKIKNKNSNLALIPKVGITYNIYKPVEYESYTTDFLGFGGSTYLRAIYPTKKISVGLGFGMDAIIPFSQKFGSKVFLLGNLNRDRSYLTFGFSILFGRIYSK